MASILVIDDEDLVRLSIGSVLRRAGHRVVLARDGEDALNRFRTARFDLVITDIVMPRMEGIETVRALRGAAAEVKIVAMSGCERAGASLYLSAAKALGADAIMAKPFSPAELNSAVARVLRSATAE